MLSKHQTLKHIENVRNILDEIIKELLTRGEKHDASKLQEPELSIFDKYTKYLKKVKYGSKEYYDYLEKMKEALDHHYIANRHHPEYHKHGITDMNLIDVLECFADWYAATKRHKDGDIFKSIEINKKRFKYDSQLETIFINTAKWIGEQDVYFQKH